MRTVGRGYKGLFDRKEEVREEGTLENRGGEERRKKAGGLKERGREREGRKANQRRAEKRGRGKR